VPADEREPTTGPLVLLETGTIELVGRMPYSSNATFLVEVREADDDSAASLAAVYKPLRGERPLRDFPAGLCRREVAAYELSEALGWGLVPETVLRQDAPLGPGSLQRFVEADFAEHYFTLLERDDLTEQFRRLAAFDWVANNADRKSGHCLLVPPDRLYAIDNGLCFHRLPKLRTVIWELAGAALTSSERTALARVADHPPVHLVDLLHPEEIVATQKRASALARQGRLPDPPPDRRPYPWPLV
jgi:uncharacterized repeat protein (TIGR03843 family)